MEYQKIKDLLDSTKSTIEFQGKKCVEKNDDVRGTYDINSQAELKTIIV